MTTKPGPRVVFDGVWRKFRRGEVHDSLRDLLPALVRRAARRPAADQLAQGDFWAVRDLSFEVGPGQVLGIIGANGSGKSTSLRILTRILEPTLGRCEVHGRVGAVIEISAGFHGDLTGRENVFLQGAIMGMRSREIARRFDEIVEFSGVAEFIDMPVKRYSSGMNARLGFAIAAHLDPDVLVIDEVLSVGDWMFQERAFGRISQLARSGIPVVIVSHQLDRVADLCTEAIFLDRGQVVARGPAMECISAYLNPQNNASNESTAMAGSPLRYDSVRVTTDEPFCSGDWFTVRVEGVVTEPLRAGLDPFTIAVRSLRSGHVLFATSTRLMNIPQLEPGPFAFELRLQANVFAGNWLVEIAARDSATEQDVVRAAPVMITVRESGVFTGTVQLNPQLRLGIAG